MKKNIPWLFTVVAYFSFLASWFVCFNALAHLCGPDCLGECLSSSTGAAASFPSPWPLEHPPPQPRSGGPGGSAHLSQVHAQGGATEALRATGPSPRAVPLTKCSPVSSPLLSWTCLTLMSTSDEYLVAFRGRRSKILPPTARMALTHCLLSTPHRTGVIMK